MPDTCPSCGAAAAGRFCAACGVALDAACPACRNPLPAGARFCNQCGAPATAVAAAAGAPERAPLPGILPWVVVAALLVVLAIDRLRDDPAPAPAVATQPQAATGDDPSAIDLASMTPRQRADRLFNRVMQSLASGDTTRLGFFTEMAVQAYGQVPERDADLHYHLGELHRMRGEAAAVRAQADSILATDPQHLFGLFTAAQAEALRGQEAAARGFYQRFLDAYPAEIARNLPEYRDHAQALPAMRAAAEQAVAGS